MKNSSTTHEDVVFYNTPCFLIYDSPEEKEYPLHWHDAVEIIMPVVNDFPVVCGSTEYILKEKDILIIPPGELHNLKLQKGRRIIMLCDNAMLEGNPALNELNTVLSRPLWINNEYDSGFVAGLNETIMEMLRIFDSARPFAEILLFQKFITLLLRIAEYRTNPENKETEGSEIMLLINRYIDSCFMNPITLDSLAENLGYSKFYLSRILSRGGISFSDMVNARRIKAAEFLLRDENCSVTQAVFNSGFSSIATFNRVFRKMKGCTPTSFREMYCEQNG